jgi:hypothetical protein
MKGSRREKKKKEREMGKIFHHLYEVVSLFVGNTGRNDFTVKTFIDPNSSKNARSTS